MNGNRIIVVCGVIALLIFIGSTVAGLVTHKKLRDFHQARYAQLCESVPVGTVLDEGLRTRLQEAGYQLDGAGDATPGKPYSVLCRWFEQGKIKRLQATRLGYPTFAEIRCDGNGVVTSVTGCEE